MEIYYPLILLILLFFIDIPIAFSLIGSSMYYFIFVNDFMPVSMVTPRFVNGLTSFSLLAIPFFIMVGSVMNYSGISESLMKMAEVLTGHMKGGLAQVNVVLSLMMGGISGSANADAAMQSKILVPQMVKRGFSAPFSAALTAASSAISPVIPPGISLIIYSLLANTSIAKMFIAGYTPAILMTIALMFTVNLISKRRNYKPSREKKASMQEIGLQVKDSIWALLIPFGIILGMRFGLFTPTEAGGVAVLFCMIVGAFIYKKLKFKHIPIILKETVQGTGSLMLLIIGAKMFGYYLTLEMIPQHITEFLTTFTSNKYTLLMFVNLLLLVMGMFLEGGAALIILTPLLLPAVTHMGVDPIHFGVIIIVNIMIGGITPPFGSMMFTTCTIVGVKLGDFVKEVIPFIISLLSVLMLLTYVESISLFLPNLLG